MQEERKGNGLLIAILLIIILILISLVGFFIYNDYYLKEDSKTVTTETNDKDTEEVTTNTLSESEALEIAQTTYENIYHKFNNEGGIWVDNNEISFKKSLELYFTEGAVTSTINGRDFFETNSLFSCVDATYTDLSLVLFDDNYIVVKGYKKFIGENGTSYDKSYGEKYIIFVKSNNSWLVASYQ